MKRMFYVLDDKANPQIAPSIKTFSSRSKNNNFS